MHATNESGVTIYEPNQRARMGWLASWALLIRNSLAYRHLIWQLFKRDFLMQYKKSFLGMGWLILAPLVGILSWVLMNSTGILKPGDVGIPYPAYVLISTSIWGLFMQLFTNTANSLQVAQSFILQVGFPHEILVLKQTAQTLVRFAITLALNLIVLLCFGVIPRWPTLLVPFFVIPLILLAAAIGMIVSIVKSVAPDLQRVFGFGIGLLMYITPVIYSPKVENPLLRRIVAWNPLTYLVGGLRDAIVYGRLDHPDRYLLSAGAALLLFLLAWRLFFVSEERVIEKLI